MIDLQCTLFSTTGKYKPMSTIVKVESVAYYNTHKTEVQTRAIQKICAQRNIEWLYLKRDGFTRMKIRVYDKKKIEAEKSGKVRTNKEKKKLDIMKEKAINLLGGLFFFIILCVLGGLEDYVKTSYTREAIVIDYYEDVCSAEDKTGNVWHFIGEGYKVGDKVKLYMNTNHTDSNILDDTITKVKMIEGE